MRSEKSVEERKVVVWSTHGVCGSNDGSRTVVALSRLPFGVLV